MTQSRGERGKSESTKRTKGGVKMPIQIPFRVSDVRGEGNIKVLWRGLGVIEGSEAPQENPGL